ncbi:LysR family transcriptional regulator [Dongshaea marina]|uniref:LysR family transcriptional regulator n=1 Tax=Dongshaea marina TaxID=2047966 RepID=UPI000D3E4EEA|nr:LysR family transcriptional regulator [Dongshaea marina]
MELESLYRRDVRLLVALQILLEEKSVTRAAQRLSLSQSAMSRVLARLRLLLDDPLFTREGQSLLPTERALELGRLCASPLEELRETLSPSDFDPTQCNQLFTIATTDYAMQTILPFALPRVYQEAPNIALHFAPLRADQLTAQLTTEGADMAICRVTSTPAPLQRSSLGAVSVFCLVHASHPLADKDLSIEDYLSYPHAMIAISDGVKALIEVARQGYGEPREVLRAYHLGAALAIIDQLPLIITAPADLAYLEAAKHDLVVKPLPFAFKPFDYSLLWHPRCQYSPAQEWIRQVITEECSRLISQRVEQMGLET